MRAAYGQYSGERGFEPGQFQRVAEQVVEVARDGAPLVLLRLEEAAQVAQDEGQPRDWPKAGRHASDLESDLIVTFGTDGLVRVRGENVEGGNWRQVIADARASEELVALHFRPERMVSELLRVLGDIRAAGFQRVALGLNAIVLDQISPDAYFHFPGYAGSPDGELNGGTASVDIAAFLAGQSHTLIDPPFAAYPGGVYAEFVFGVTGDPFLLPDWP